MQNKTKSNRVKEVIQLLRQLSKYGFQKQNEGIIEFTNILKQWVDDGKYMKGKIKLRGYERVIEYGLHNSKGMEIAVNLKFVKGL